MQSDVTDEGTMKKLPRNVAAEEAFEKLRSKSEIVHRRIELKIEREIVSVLFCPAMEHSSPKGRCSHCGQVVPDFESPLPNQQD
jgi:hypothetical protein